jgi:hypothetical protein
MSESTIIKCTYCDQENSVLLENLSKTNRCAKCRKELCLNQS